MHVINKSMGAAIALFSGWLQLLGHQQGWTHHPAPASSRGDVPGWVLITLMSAILVAGLLAIAGPALEGLFNQAMEQVIP